MMAFVWRLGAGVCAQRGMGVAGGKRGGPVGRGKSRMVRSFKTFHASYDKRVVGEGHEARLARDVVGGAINQE